MTAPYQFARAFTVDGVHAIRGPVDVLAPGAWSRAQAATFGDPATVAGRDVIYGQALAERCPTVPIAISANSDGVLTFSAATGQVDLVAEGGAVVAELVPLTLTPG